MYVIIETEPKKNAAKVVRKQDRIFKDKPPETGLIKVQVDERTWVMCKPGAEKETREKWLKVLARNKKIPKIGYIAVKK